MSDLLINNGESSDGQAEAGAIAASRLAARRLAEAREVAKARFQLSFHEAPGKYQQSLLSRTRCEDPAERTQALREYKQWSQLKPAQKEAFAAGYLARQSLSAWGSARPAFALVSSIQFPVSGQEGEPGSPPSTPGVPNFINPALTRP